MTYRGTGSAVNTLQVWDGTSWVPLLNLSVLDSGTDLELSNPNGSITLSDLEYLSFDPLSTLPSYLEGLLFYDDDEHALAYYNDQSDVIVQIGLETYVRVVNKTGSTISNASPVYIDGVLGNRPTVDLAIATSGITGRAIGLTTHDILDNQEGLVTIDGTIAADTSGFVAGQPVWVSATTPGTLTQVPPTGTDVVWFMGLPLNSTINGKILVQPTGPATLRSLHDVDDGTPTLGNVLVGDGSYWTSQVLSASFVENTPGLPGATVQDALDGIEELRQIIQEPSGFVNRTDSTLSFTDGTRTFQIAPDVTDYTFFVKGAKYIKNSAESVVWTNVEGLHYFGFDNTGTLQHSVDEADVIDWISGNGAFISAIYWDATNSESIIRAEERHGFMPGTTHIHFHRGLGTLWYVGGALTGILPDDTGNLDSHAQFGVSDLIFADEDIVFDVSDGNPQTLANPAEIPMYWRDGANGDWRRRAANTFPTIYSGDGSGYVGGSGRLPYNEFTGAVWQLTEVGNNDFCLTHYFATDDINEPVVGIQGQETYGTVVAARQGALDELRSLSLGQLEGLSAEFTPLGTVIWQTSSGYTNTVEGRIRSTDEGDDYVDFRGTSVGGSGGGGDAVVSVFGRSGAVVAEAGDYRDTVTTRANATYTPDVSWENDIGLYTNVAGCTVTLPLDSTAAFSPGASFVGYQKAAGAITIAGEAGTTIAYFNSTSATVNVNDSFVCTKISSNTWQVTVTSS